MTQHEQILRALEGVGSLTQAEALRAQIEAILKRGNDAEIRRKGSGYVVLEVKKTIKYSTPA